MRDPSAAILGPLPSINRCFIPGWCAATLPRCRSSSRGSARKSGEEPSMSMSKREMASPSMPRGGSYPYLVVNATATT